MEPELKPDKINEIMELIDSLNLNEEEFEKIYQNIENQIKGDPNKLSLLSKIKKKSKLHDIDQKDLVIQLLNELNSEEMVRLFQGKDFKLFIQDFILKKFL